MNLYKHGLHTLHIWIYLLSKYVCTHTKKTYGDYSCDTISLCVWTSIDPRDFAVDPWLCIVVIHSRMRFSWNEGHQNHTKIRFRYWNPWFWGSSIVRNRYVPFLKHCIYWVWYLYIGYLNLEYGYTIKPTWPWHMSYSWLYIYIYVVWCPTPQ